MSITVSISADETHAPDVDADEMSNSRRTPSLILDSVGVDHPCCRKPHGSLRSFSLTGTIFWSILSHFARIQSSISQSSTNHLLCGFYLHFHRRLASKAPKLIRPPADWYTAVTLLAAIISDARSIIYLFKIFEYAAKQACKQLQCNKAKLSEPCSINGLHIHRALGYADAGQIKYTLDENIGGHIYTVRVTTTLAHVSTYNHLLTVYRAYDTYRLGPHVTIVEYLGWLSLTLRSTAGLKRASSGGVALSGASTQNPRTVTWRRGRYDLFACKAFPIAILHFDVIPTNSGKLQRQTSVGFAHRSRIRIETNAWHPSCVYSCSPESG